MTSERKILCYTRKLDLLKSWKQQKCPCLFQLPDDCIKLWIAYCTREKEKTLAFDLFQHQQKKGDPKSRNDGTAEWRNHGITERRKMTPNPKRRNRGMVERHKITPNPKRRNRGTAEWRKIPQNPKRRNDGKCLEILKDGKMENDPKS